MAAALPQPIDCCRDACTTSTSTTGTGGQQWIFENRDPVNGVDNPPAGSPVKGWVNTSNGGQWSYDGSNWNQMLGIPVI